MTPFDDLLDGDASDDGEESASPRDSENITASEKRSVDDVVPQSDQFPEQSDDDGEQYIYLHMYSTGQLKLPQIFLALISCSDEIFC